MDYRSEAALERLVELSDDPSIDELTVLRTWRQERLAKRIEHEEQIKRLAEQYPVKYGLMRIEQGEQQMGGTFGNILYPAEYVSVLESDVYSFAKDKGLSLTGLWEVLRGQRQQVGKWRSWEGLRNGSSKAYVDRSAQVAFQAEMVEEDRKLEKRIKSRNDRLKRAVKPLEAVPKYSEYGG